MPKISVIIPTYNRAQFVVKAVRSALHQTFQDREISIDHSIRSLGEYLLSLPPTGSRSRIPVLGGEGHAVKGGKPC